MKKVSVFVDVQNIYYTTKQQFNSNFDYNKFWKLVTHQREVVGAFAYATNRGDAKQIQFQNILRAIGFEVKLKPFICLLYTSPSPRDATLSRMPSSA